jgi:diguanylate cyclase (GGDEF)-like protein
MTQSSAPIAAIKAVQNEIDADLVETLFDTRGSFFAALIGGLVTPILALYMTGDGVYLLLLALMSVMALYRLHVFWAHTRVPPEVRRRAAKKWATLYAIGGVGFVTLVGLTTAILFSRQHLDLAFCYSLVTMMAGVGALSGRNAGSPNIVFVQLVGLCAPLAIVTVFDPDPHYRWLALILVLETISIKSVTEYQHKNLESALRNGYDAEMNRKRFGVALHSMSHGLCMGDANLQVSVVNNRLIEFFGAVAASTPVRLDVLAEAIGQNAGLTAAETKQFVDRWRNHAAMPHANVFSQDIGERVFDFRCEPADAGGFVTVIEDVTIQRNIVREMERLAHFDSLTGLPNRHRFQQQLEEGLLQASTCGSQLTILNIDLDRFKEVNDTLGHATGDELLRAVAVRLRHQTRPVDIVARFGGDEFCVLFPPRAEPIDAEQVAERIIQELRKPFMIDQHVIAIDASVGIAVAPRDTTTAEGLMRFSDLALYRAKSAGRGKAMSFQTKMLDALEKRRQTELDLRFAVEQEELVLYYQPIVDSRDRRVTCCESLMRWRHPVRGLVPPLEFIPIAEDTGLVVPLGEWAIRRACRDALTWPGDIRVAVNLSPRQFQQKNLVPMIKSAVLDSGLPPERLEIEITESTLMQDTQDVSRKIDELVAFGVRLSLDDFGTGYSSLGYLNRFPVNKVKLDRSFTLRVNDSPKTRAIVGAISSLARDLDIELVAEGVETNEQLAQLALKNVFLIQGFLFSRPIPLEQLMPLLARWDAPVALERQNQNDAGLPKVPQVDRLAS